MPERGAGAARAAKELKRLDDAYRPSVRGWQRYKVRETSEAIVGAVTGSPAAPRTLLLGRYDDQAAFSTSAAPALSPGQRVLQWADFSLRPSAAIPGRAGLSTPGGEPGRR
ncbi:hypothetical protein ACFWA5_50775 [Streptomyces mirabilis]|uniref:hypothetical protein n=1 Tax=Streptomyces mirabilis TaxID=68239 RepID=UPI0036652849